MLRIATVEDDANDLEALRTHLSRYEKENGLKFQVTEFRDGEDIVTDYSADYDLILMDIEMAFLNGMKAAEKIRELDKDVIIIFITNMPQYAIQGYKVNALDYMLKPISYFSFSESMGRALHRVNVQEKEFITIALKGGKKKLDITQICYVEVQDHLLLYHTTEGSFATKGTIRDAESQLDAKSFFRCNRCYLVNLEYGMDQRQSRTAADIVNGYDERELYRIIRDYGEDKFAKNIAKHIVAARAKAPIQTTGELTEIIRQSIPMKIQATGGHPAKRTFQAIRIELNRELDVLRESLDGMIDLLDDGGRICIITFHSLEDRIVKTIFRKNENPCTCPPDFPVCVCGKKSKGKVITRKPILPSETEMEENPRSKSAKLRIFERRYL